MKRRLLVAKAMVHSPPVLVLDEPTAGVDVELDNAETLVHGYLGYSGVVPAATEATARGLAALRSALHPPAEQ